MLLLINLFFFCFRNVYLGLLKFKNNCNKIYEKDCVMSGPDWCCREIGLKFQIPVMCVNPHVCLFKAYVLFIRGRTSIT